LAVGLARIDDRIGLPTDKSRGSIERSSTPSRPPSAPTPPLCVLYVVDSDAYGSPGEEYVHEFESLASAPERAGREAVEEIVRRVDAASVATEASVRHGVAHEEILRYIEEEDVDLAVVGSKKRPGEDRRLPGSVADRVATMAERPVTIVETPVEDA
jgi:nucleotide-binding universal stress UspA family protein